MILTQGSWPAGWGKAHSPHRDHRTNLAAYRCAGGRFVAGRRTAFAGLVDATGPVAARRCDAGALRCAAGPGARRLGGLGRLAAACGNPTDIGRHAGAAVRLHTGLVQRRRHVGHFERQFAAARLGVGCGLGGARPGGKRGRGSENKVPFIAAVQTSPEGHPLYAVFTKVKTFGRADVQNWALKHLASASVVVSDGLNCFTAVQAAGAKHAPSVVGTTRKSSAMPCFRWINTILSNLKTATSGTYHAFDFRKYGFLYLAEAQYRFNRRFDLSNILKRLLFAAVATGSRTEAWCRLAEDQR